MSACKQEALHTITVFGVRACIMREDVDDGYKKKKVGLDYLIQ